MDIGSILRCTECNGDLLEQAEHKCALKEKGMPGCYACAVCGREYPVVEDVIDFLPGTADRKRKLGQWFMEFEPIVKNYESRYIRDSRLFSWLTGITLEEEMNLIQRLADSGPRDTILDLACGPGLYTRTFAEGGSERKTVGLDLSWPMLKRASREEKELGLENIALVHGDAHSLPFGDSSFDVVNCTGGLHNFPDLPRALDEVQRVLKSAGRFTMAVLRRIGSGRVRLLDPFYHFFSPEELNVLMNDAGFELEIHHARGFWIIAVATRR